MEDVPSLRGERAAGAVLHRLPPLAAGFILVSALTAAVLTPLHLWRPWVAVPVVLVAMAFVWRVVAGLPARPVPIWTFCWSAASAVGYTVWVALTHAEHVVLRRDAGSYALFTQWIATRHALPVDVRLGAFGGSAALSDPHLGVGSAAFYGVLHSAGTPDASAVVVPQFLIGAPATMSFGWWAAGWNGMFVVPALAGGLAVLAMAGLTTRLVGARWAPLAAATLALAQPVVHVGRSTYSEPFALLLVLVAASVLYDAVRAWPARLTPSSSPAAVNAVVDGARRLAWVAGLGAGLTGLVRVDALREAALLLPVIALLAVAGHPAARPMLWGLSSGVAVAGAVAASLSGPYLRDISGSLVPLGVLVVVLGLASYAFVRWCRARGRPRGPARLPDVASAVVVVLGVMVAARPLFMTVRQSATDRGALFVASLQSSQGLPIDGGRTYAERSVQWVVWYLGPVVPVLTLLVAAVATRRALAWWRQDWSVATSSAPRVWAAAGAAVPEPVRVPPWLGVAFVGAGSTLLTLWRPGITPDHPWADRRLVPVVLPFFIIGATAAIAWATREARRRLPATLLVGVAVLGVASMLVPAALAAWPLATQRTERGELRAVQQVCSSLSPKDAVIMLDTRSSQEWSQVVRGVCGNPVAVLRLREGERGRARLPTVRSAVPAIAQRTIDAGYRPVLMTGDDAAAIETLGLQPRRVATFTTIEDQRLLTRRPSGDRELVTSVWTAPWAATPLASNG